MQRLYIVRHYKGAYYQVVMESEHTETGEALVTYQQLYASHDKPPGYCWTRPKAMFDSLAPGARHRRRFTAVPEHCIPRRVANLALALRLEMRRRVKE